MHLCFISLTFISIHYQRLNGFLRVFQYALSSLLLDLQFNLMQQNQIKIDVIDIFDDITIMLTLVKLHWILLQPTRRIEYKYSQNLGVAIEYKHEYCSFLLSPLAVKRDIAATILLRCMCVRVCMHACLRMSIRICPGHNFCIYACISKLFNTVFVLEEE